MRVLHGITRNVHSFYSDISIIFRNGISDLSQVFFSIFQSALKCRLMSTRRFKVKTDQAQRQPEESRSAKVDEEGQGQLVSISTKADH